MGIEISMPLASHIILGTALKGRQIMKPQWVPKRVEKWGIPSPSGCEVKL